MTIKTAWLQEDIYKERLQRFRVWAKSEVHKQLKPWPIPGKQGRRLAVRTELQVLRLLASRANRPTDVLPVAFLLEVSRLEVAETLALSERTVAYAFRALEHHGLLAVADAPNNGRRGGESRTYVVGPGAHLWKTTPPRRTGATVHKNGCNGAPDDVHGCTRSDASPLVDGGESALFVSGRDVHTRGHPASLCTTTPRAAGCESCDDTGTIASGRNTRTCPVCHGTPPPPRLHLVPDDNEPDPPPPRAS